MTVIDHLVGRLADDPAVALVTRLGAAGLGLLPLHLAIRRGRLGGCAGGLLRPLQPQPQLDQLFPAQSLKIAPAHQSRESAFRLRRKGVGKYRDGAPRHNLFSKGSQICVEVAFGRRGILRGFIE